MKNILLILSFLISTTAFAQLKKSLSDKRDKVETDFKHLLDSKNYIIYSTPKKLLLFIEKTDEKFFYFEFISNSDESDYELCQLFNIDLNVGRLLFGKDNYESGYIDFSSDFYKEGITSSASGAALYVSYNTSYRQRFCEYYLTTIVAPSPIKRKAAYILFLYLVDRENDIHD